MFARSRAAGGYDPPELCEVLSRLQALDVFSGYVEGLLGTADDNDVPGHDFAWCVVIYHPFGFPLARIAIPASVPGPNGSARSATSSPAPYSAAGTSRRCCHPGTTASDPMGHQSNRRRRRRSGRCTRARHRRHLTPCRTWGKQGIAVDPAAASTVGTGDISPSARGDATNGGPRCGPPACMAPSPRPTRFTSAERDVHQLRVTALATDRVDVLDAQRRSSYDAQQDHHRASSAMALPGANSQRAG